MKSLLMLSFLLVAGLTPLLATPAQAQTFAFTSVAVDGNERIPDSTVVNYVGLTPGQPVSAAALNDAFQRLQATGLFESVELIPQGRRLLVRVSEYPTINRINVEGNRRINDEAAMALFGSQPRRVFSPSQVEQDAAALTQAYRDQGRLSATVTPRIIRRSNNRVDVVFEVREGRVVEIERLSFVGNRVYPDSRLRRVLATKQAGALRLLIAKDTFVEDRIEFDKALLRDFYLARGYVDFRIQSVASEFSRERNAFFLTFNIQEGQKFNFGKISVVSEIDGVDARDYERDVRIRTGRTYTPQLVDNAISRIERSALRNGQNLLRVDPRVTRNDRDLTLDIEFALVRGPRVFVERIDIEGNASTLDRVVRRQFRIVEGDPFNPREIREAAARIRALGLFDSADVNAREGSASDQVIVDVNVDESLTGSLTFGAAYSLSNGIGLTANYKERNLLGRGQTLNFDLTLGLDNASGGLTFIEPAFLGRDLAFRLDGEYRQTEFEYTNYDTLTFNIQPSFEFPISDSTRLQLRYGVTSDKIFNVAAASSPILKAEEATGTVLTSALGYTISYDTRRTGLNPSAGILLRFGQDFAGVGGDAEYIKSTATVGGEIKVWNDALTLRATLEGGALQTSAGPSRLTDRFFLTSSRMRGFEPAGVGPRDLTVGNRDALGGNYFAVARFETEFPLGLPEEFGITGGLFFDVGSVWGLDNNNGGLVDDSMNLRSTVGISIFWTTPIGPLRFNFSNVLQKEPYDKPQTFDLTISTTF